MCAFPPGKELWHVSSRTLVSRSVCRQATPPSTTLQGQWVPPSAAFGSWTARDINGLLGMWQSSYGVFGSSSKITEISSFTPDRTETTAPLLASAGEILRLCCSNQAEVWGELSARCDGVCQSRDGFQAHGRQGKGAKHSVICRHYLYSVFIIGTYHAGAFAYMPEGPIANPLAQPLG